MALVISKRHVIPSDLTMIDSLGIKNLLNSIRFESGRVVINEYYKNTKM